MAQGDNNIGLTPQILRPVASPTDTYGRTDAGQQLGQLAEGLSQYAPALKQFSDVTFEKQKQTEIQAGQNTARAIQESGKTYKQAIDSGLIRQDQSPWFRIGAYETFGRASAHTYSGDLEVALSQSQVAESTNPNDFDAFEQKFRADWTEKNLGTSQQDPYLSNAFGSQADNLVEAQRGRFAAEAGDRLVKMSGDAFHALVAAQALEGFKNGASTADIVASLTTANEQNIANGMSREVSNRLLASGLFAAATDGEGNARAIDVMKAVKLGTGFLSGTSYGAEFAKQARSYIYQQEITRQEKETRVGRVQKAMSVLSDMEDVLIQSKDPGSEDISQYAQRMRQIDPTRVDDLYSLRDKISTSTNKSDQNLLRKLTADVYSGDAGPQELRHALLANQISMPDFTKLATAAREVEKDGADKQMRNDRWFAIGKEAIKDVFVSQYGSKAEERMQGSTAMTDWATAYYTFKKNNPDVFSDPNKPDNSLRINAFISQERDVIMGRVGTKAEKSAYQKIPHSQVDSNLSDVQDGPKITWKNHLVTSSDNVEKLYKEVREVEQSHASKLSNWAHDVLTQSGVDDTNADEIRTFIAMQRHWAKLMTPPPSDSNEP